jgi:hypothetical protein
MTGSIGTKGSPSHAGVDENSRRACRAARKPFHQRDTRRSSDADRVTYARLPHQEGEIVPIIRVYDLPRDALDERAAATGRSLIGSSTS